MNKRPTPISAKDWNNTPPEVRQLLVSLRDKVTTTGDTEKLLMELDGNQPDREKYAQLRQAVGDLVTSLRDIADAVDPLEVFLTHLDTNRDKALEKYELLRRKLEDIFDNNGFDPSPAIEETIRRVVKKIKEGEAIENVGGYAYRVARNILRELERTVEVELPSGELFPDPPARKDSNEEWQDRCLDKCSRRLPPETRWLILEYYNYEKVGRRGSNKSIWREQLAGRLKITKGKLTARAFKIREELDPCIRQCVREHQGSENVF